jgi:putative lipoic acid-binding regulatory protein
MCAMQENQSLLKFPCRFPIKAMGHSESGFELKALAIVRKHVPDFKDENMKSLDSRKGNYRSLTFVVDATSQDQLDALYRDLTACDELLMVL